MQTQNKFTINYKNQKKKKKWDINFRIKPKEKIRDKKVNKTINTSKIKGNKSVIIRVEHPNQCCAYMKIIVCIKIKLVQKIKITYIRNYKRKKARSTSSKQLKNTLKTTVGSQVIPLVFKQVSYQSARTVQRKLLKEKRKRSRRLRLYLILNSIMIYSG